MDFKQIEAYIKVIELASFSKAAETIFLSQPSVSTYINSLEKELTTTLINRSTKEVSPTYAGKLFYEDAKEILALKDNSIKRLKSLSKNLSGEINILASTVPSQYILPKMIASFNQIYPSISFNVRQADTLDVSRGIALHQAEIGFSGGTTDNEKCEFNEFMAEKMVFIAPYNQGFSTLTEYSLDELLYKHPFISREKGSGTRTQYEHYFINQNIDLSKINAYACFDNTQSIINAVMDGLGIAIVSEVAARLYIKQNLIIPVKLQNELPERKLYYVLKKNFSHSHLIDLFVGFISN